MIIKKNLFFLKFIVLSLIIFSITFLFFTESVFSETVTLPNPLGEGEDVNKPQVLIGKIINGALGIVGSLALVMFIYGGFTWMLSGGNAENVTKGKNILIWATIGLVIIFTSYTLVFFVFSNLLDLTM